MAMKSLILCSASIAALVLGAPAHAQAMSTTPQDQNGLPATGTPAGVDGTTVRTPPVAEQLATDQTAPDQNDADIVVTGVRA